MINSFSVFNWRTVKPYKDKVYDNSKVSRHRGAISLFTVLVNNKSNYVTNKLLNCLRQPNFIWIVEFDGKKWNQMKQSNEVRVRAAVWLASHSFSLHQCSRSVILFLFVGYRPQAHLRRKTIKQTQFSFICLLSFFGLAFIEERMNKSWVCLFGKMNLMELDEIEWDESWTGVKTYNQ